MESEEVAILSKQAKLFRWGEQNAGVQWKDCGDGTVELLRSMETGMARLSMCPVKNRAAGVVHPLMEGMKLERTFGCERSWVYRPSRTETKSNVQTETKSEKSDGAAQNTKFSPVEALSLRFKTKEDADEFKSAFEGALHKNISILRRIAMEVAMADAAAKAAVDKEIARVEAAEAAEVAAAKSKLAHAAAGASSAASSRPHARHTAADDDLSSSPTLASLSAFSEAAVPLKLPDAGQGAKAGGHAAAAAASAVSLRPQAANTESGASPSVPSSSSKATTDQSTAVAQALVSSSSLSSTAASVPANATSEDNRERSATTIKSDSKQNTNSTTTSEATQFNSAAHPTTATDTASVKPTATTDTASAKPAFSAASSAGTSSTHSPVVRSRSNTTTRSGTTTEHASSSEGTNE